MERLFKGDTPSLEVNSICERPFFNNTITDNYWQINDFRGYYRRWAAAQSFWLYYQLSDRTIKQQYAQSRDKFQEACEEVFETSLKSQVGCIQGWAKDWQALSGKSGNPIAKDAGNLTTIGLGKLTNA